MIYHIVCMAQNRVIGRNGGMPWHIPDDLRRFRQTTLGSSLVMGRKTFESLPGKLAGREHVVVSRSVEADFGEDIHICAEIEQACVVAKQLSSSGKVFIIGGGEIYRQSMSFVTRIYMTYLYKDFSGNITYPMIDKAFVLAHSDQQEVACSLVDADHSEQCLLQVSYQIYERSSAK